MTATPELVPQDIAIKDGERRVFSRGVFVNGWVTLAGRLECDGELHCLGLSMHGGSALVCHQLLTNVLEVDSKRARLELASIRARVVHHADFALRELVDKGVVVADYVQHVGGGADYARGVNPLGEDYFEARGGGAPVVLEISAMRTAQHAGKRLFRRMEPLVAQRSRTAIAAATRDPLVEELIAWLAAHPGPQRATLSALEADWTDRLSGASTEIRSDALAQVKRVIKSPKLADAVEAWSARVQGALG